ncbi:MAG TPA: hypothetical protein VG798_02810 [Rhizomicrobium sp.]|nr:hypothetical protein [Rhizomicrobium sp.]HWC62088.1 hypothetical protein [Rhizomicrobium sp.]
MIVFVAEPILEKAREVFRNTLERAGWAMPHLRHVVQVDHKMRLGRLKQLELGAAVSAAIQDGSAVVVFDGTEVI